MHIQALDLGHLTDQTLGDKDLEYQLLTLFRVQARQIMAHLQNASHASPKDIADFAHLLNGSALAIGATRVAAMAAAYENLIVNPRNDGSDLAHLEALAEAVADAAAAIDLRIGLSVEG